jgi:hypothetical protein
LLWGAALIRSPERGAVGRGCAHTQLLVTDSVHGPPQEEHTLHFSTPLVPEHGT